MSDNESLEIVQPDTARVREPAPAAQPGSHSFTWTPATILAVAAAISLLMVGGGVGYYFIGFLPMKFAREQAARAEAEKKQAEAAAAAASAAVARQETRQKTYQACLAAAEVNYTANWNRSCQSNADDQERRRADCIRQNYDANQCYAVFPPLPTTDCKLSETVADNWNSNLEIEKARCLAQSKEGL